MSNYPSTGGSSPPAYWYSRLQQFDVGFHYRSPSLILDPRVQQVDLTRVTRDVTALVAAHPDRSDKVRVTCFVPDDGIVHVAGDEDLVQRAISAPRSTPCRPGQTKATPASSCRAARRSPYPPPALSPAVPLARSSRPEPTVLGAEYA